MRVGKYNLGGITIFNGFGVLVVVYLVVVLGQTIKHNYDLGQQISQLNAQVALIQAQRDQLDSQIKYYATQSYQEKQAHSQLGLVVPGETEVVIPTPQATPTPGATPSATTHKSSNWSQWIGFLSGKN